MKKTKTFYPFLLSIFLLPGCASMNKSLILGAGTGAVTGLAVSDYAGKHDSQNQTKASLLGALIGGITTYFVHRNLEKRDERVRQETLFNLEKFGVHGIQTNEGETSGRNFR